MRKTGGFYLCLHIRIIGEVSRVTMDLSAKPWCIGWDSDINVFWKILQWFRCTIGVQVGYATWHEIKNPPVLVVYNKIIFFFHSCDSRWTWVCSVGLGSRLHVSILCVSFWDQQLSRDKPSLWTWQESQRLKHNVVPDTLTLEQARYHFLPLLLVKANHMTKLSNNGARKYVPSAMGSKAKSHEVELEPKT